MEGERRDDRLEKSGRQGKELWRKSLNRKKKKNDVASEIKSS